MGCLAAILLLAAIIFRVLLVAKNAQIPFHSYLCVGMAAMLIFQTIINIGMCLFIMPVIGITLPFFSYGGSSVVTLFMARGMVSGIKKRSPTMRRPGRPLAGKDHRIICRSSKAGDCGLRLFLHTFRGGGRH